LASLGNFPTVLSQGQVDFAETMETENGNGNTETETRKEKNCASYSTASRTSVFYFVHSWL